MSTYYCTFGATHHLDGCYVRIDANSSLDAHQQMYEAYGAQWAFCYPQEKFVDSIERFGLTEVPFGSHTRIGNEVT